MWRGLEEKSCVRNRLAQESEKLETGIGTCCLGCPSASQRSEIAKQSIILTSNSHRVTIGPHILIEISLSPLIEISKESCAWILVCLLLRVVWVKPSWPLALHSILAFWMAAALQIRTYVRNCFSSKCHDLHPWQGRSYKCIALTNGLHGNTLGAYF